jgi:hypothetical protein
MPDIADLFKAAAQAAQDPKIFLVLGFLVLAFVASKIVPPGRGGTVVWIVLVLVAIAVYGRLVWQNYPERRPVELTRRGFTPIYSGRPQLNGCWCEQGVNTVAFVNHDASRQVTALDAVSGEPVEFGWDADYICHKQTINDYRDNIADMSGNFGTISIDGEHVGIIPDIYGKAKIKYAKSTGAHPHIVTVAVNASCVDTRAANCGFPGHQCTATGLLTINVKPK